MNLLMKLCCKVGLFYVPFDANWATLRYLGFQIGFFNNILPSDELVSMIATVVKSTPRLAPM